MLHDRASGGVQHCHSACYVRTHAQHGSISHASGAFRTPVLPQRACARVSTEDLSLPVSAQELAGCCGQQEHAGAPDGRRTERPVLPAVVAGPACSDSHTGVSVCTRFDPAV